MEVRIRGRREFIFAVCGSDVLEKMMEEGYISHGMAPFTPTKKAELTGVVYMTRSGTIILDDLSRLEKEAIE